jgi:DNA-binding CsgD family transcriptional regulator
MAERMVRCAAVELALLQGEAARALQMIDQLADSQPASAQGKRSMRVLRLRGEALLALQRPAEAETDFKEALRLGEEGGARPVQWRVALALSKLYSSQGRAAEGEQARAIARALVDDLVLTISDESLRAHFRQAAIREFPSSALSAPAAPSARDSHAGPALGGLTPREREVAILIARGESNQAIADTLVVTKRTVETHIGNIMFKLGSHSRTQIAVWAVESGLTGPNRGGSPA